MVFESLAADGDVHIGPLKQIVRTNRRVDAADHDGGFRERFLDHARGGEGASHQGRRAGDADDLESPSARTAAERPFLDLGVIDLDLDALGPRARRRDRADPWVA